MLCSGAELNLSEDHDGLLALAADAPVGTPIEDYLDLNDRLIEIGLTPNRADCLSVAGVARDLAVATGTEMSAPKLEAVAAAIDYTLPVEVTAPADCPRTGARHPRRGRLPANTALYGGAPAPGRYPLHRCGGGHHQLRDA